MAVHQARVTTSTFATPPTAKSQLRRKSHTYWGIVFQSLRRDKLTMAATTFVFVLGLLALTARPIVNTLVGVGPNDTNPRNALQQPYIWPYLKWRLGLDPTTAATMLGKSGGVTHWLGTDQLGRDQLARLLYGGRVSLTIAIVAALISLLLGVSVGAIAGYFGGLIDDTVMWLINTVQSIPTIYLLIIITAIFKPNPVTLTLFLGVLGWFGTARFMRGNVFKVKELDYTLAARAIGATNIRILFDHIVPNCIPVIVVVTAIDVGALILTESALSFLGLGVQPPTATWGSMMDRANDLIFLRDPATHSLQAWHLLFPPGMLITLTVLAFYLIGDGLRDALDPTLKHRN